MVRFDEEEVVPIRASRSVPGDGDGEKVEVEREGKGGGKAVAISEEEFTARRKRRGGTRQTKNIGLMVGLGWKGEEGEAGKEGVIIVTTHL